MKLAGVIGEIALDVEERKTVVAAEFGILAPQPISARDVPEAAQIREIEACAATEIEQA